MGSLRTAVSASLLAASLTTLLATCGHQHPAAGAHPSQSVGGTGRIDSGLAYVTSTTGAVPETRAVLRNEGQLTAFARRFDKQAEAILTKARKNDFGRNALVGWSRTTGCAAWPSATLHRAGRGDRLVLAAAAHPMPPPECFAPLHIIAIFTAPMGGCLPGHASPPLDERSRLILNEVEPNHRFPLTGPHPAHQRVI